MRAFMRLVADERAAPGRTLDQPFDLDPLQGDAHGRPADIKMTRKLRFGGDAFALRPPS